MNKNDKLIFKILWWVKYEITAHFDDDRYSKTLETIGYEIFKKWNIDGYFDTFEKANLILEKLKLLIKANDLDLISTEETEKKEEISKLSTIYKMLIENISKKEND